MSFYDLSINSPAGDSMNMSDFKGKAVLVVNTATKCGLTPQFDGLEKLNQKYQDQGLVILGFPCNQFLNQSPESNDEVVDVCRINHGVTFPLTKKIDVNGADAHPIFVYLKKELSGMLGSTIKWNFTKFLITPDGKPYKRFSPKTEPEELEADIIKVLGTGIN